MLVLKSCPRCHGDLASDYFDPGEWTCLQCGHITYPTPPLPFVRERGLRATRMGKSRRDESHRAARVLAE